MVESFVERKSHFYKLSDVLWHTIDGIKISCYFVANFDIFLMLRHDTYCANVAKYTVPRGRIPCGSKVKHSCMHSKNRIVINRFLFRIIKLSPINQIKNRRKAKVQKIFWWVRVTNDHMCCSCNGLVVCSGKNFLSELFNIPFQGNKNAPWPGIEPGPPEWESGILTPRPSGTWWLCS